MHTYLPPLRPLPSCAPLGRPLRPPDCASSNIASRCWRTESATREASPTGTLDVICTPDCDRIEIDGVDMGPSPLAPLQLKAGLHVVVLRRGNTHRQRLVTVSANETATVQVTMVNARPVTTGVVTQPGF